jgi:hypothetical protein
MSFTGAAVWHVLDVLLETATSNAASVNLVGNLGLVVMHSWNPFMAILGDLELSAWLTWLMF